MLTFRGLAAGAFLLLASAHHAVAQPATTFSQQIAPILRTHCASCHQPDGDAPFSLISFADARRRANQIADVTSRRSMPPWKPDDVGVFSGERRLSDHDIDTIRRWARAGAPEGTPSGRALTTDRTSRWRNGEPDLIVTLPAYTLRADGPDVFRNFVVTIPGADAHYVRAWQFRPGSPAVHHANIRVDPTSASRRLDESDPQPGYEGMILHSADYPDGHFLGWTPGQASVASTELAWTLQGGNDLVVQLHLRPTGRPEVVSPSIGLYFTKRAPSKTPAIIRLGRQNVDIPVGTTDYRVNDDFVLPVACDIVAIQPHAHYRAKTVRAWASLPDGREQRLISIRDWDFNWQDQYRYATPLRVPAGTTLHMEYSFDNSDANPRNPSHPAARVGWGWRSSDEMADVWIQMMTASEAERHTLTAAARRKMANEDAVGSEVLIAREPNYATLRNDAALIYMEIGQPTKALEHFAVVTRLEPSPAAWFNEGVALEAMGKLTEARARYLNAIRLDPQYSAAHNNLANVLYRSGDVNGAVSHYEIAVSTDPLNVEAHCAFARVLTESGKPADAVAEYRTATTLRPDWAPCLINFSWLLSAHADAAVRQPTEAVRLAERAAEVTDHRDPVALDALASAYASAGRFDAAIKTAATAATLAEQQGLAESAGQIHARLELYKRGRPFVVMN